jgi:hypothetical protein
MHDPVGWAMAAMALAMANPRVPQPGLSRPEIVFERAGAAACHADDDGDGGPLEVEVTVRNTGGAPTAHLVAWPLAAPGATSVPAPAAFGAIEPGDVATHAVRFAGYGACGRPESVTVGLMDRGVSLGVLSIPLRNVEDGRD